MTNELHTPTPDLADWVDAFESARTHNPKVDLAAFLPASTDPHYLSILTELIRIDLDMGWTTGYPTPLADYAMRFPGPFEDDALVAAVAFEEYRQRRLHGEMALPGEYRATYLIDTSDWPLIAASGVLSGERPHRQTVMESIVPVALAAASSDTGTHLSRPTPPAQYTPGSMLSDLDRSEPELMDQRSAVERAMPVVGEVFLGFRLLEELGRGAFGRVFLAEQGTLGGRPVALKVAGDIFSESRTLAQLQHTNIVPIYSFHTAGPLQAVCMPYFGRTTLAQVVQRISYRPNLPSSGRELKSTVNAQQGSTVTSRFTPAPISPVAPADAIASSVGPTTVAAETLADWAKLDGLSYEEAVLWLGVQLTDGLIHAHARGILHRDLKPANVLLTDEGRPMLLDFNLAEDVKLRGSPGRAAMGGTLPYMAPEQIRVFRDKRGAIDGRADLYSLGVILFELLTGRHPFPNRTGPANVAIDHMLSDRHGTVPDVRSLNPAVSPSTASILSKCLAANPANRYASAAHLRDDLQRQLDFRPLRFAPNPSTKERVRKWVRRHPRLASSGTLAGIAATMLLSVGASAAYTNDRLKDHQARTTLIDHRRDFADAQLFLDDRKQSQPKLDEATTRLRGLLDRYHVPADDSGEGWLDSPLVKRLPEADQTRLREDVGETFYLMAQVASLKAMNGVRAEERAEQTRLAEQWNAAAEHHGGSRLSKALREQRAEVAALAGDQERSRRLRTEADTTMARSARDRYLLGVLYARQGRHRESLTYLQAATQIDPENFSAWFFRGTVHLALEQNEMAALCFGSCTALRKDYAPAWLNRGLAYSRLRFFDQAVADFDRAVSLNEKLVEAYLLRGGAKDALGNLKGAEEDYTFALETGAAPVRVYFLRSDVRERRKDRAGAAADRADGLRLTPNDSLSWVARAEVRADTEPAAALKDVDEALALDPDLLPALQTKAHLLAEKLQRPEEAIKVLDRAVTIYSDHAAVYAGRGVLLARQGKRDAAIRDAEDALLRDTKAPNLYQVACIYALTSKQTPTDRLEAHHLLWQALKTGFGHDLVGTDPDLDPIRTDPAFTRLVTSAKDHAAMP